MQFCSTKNSLENKESQKARGVGLFGFLNSFSNAIMCRELCYFVSSCAFLRRPLSAAAAAPPMQAASISNTKAGGNAWPVADKTDSLTVTLISCVTPLTL